MLIDLKTNQVSHQDIGQMDMYVRINELCKEDENVLERCRENFRL